MSYTGVLKFVMVGAVATSVILPVAAQSATAAPTKTASGYDLPPKNILDVMTAPVPPYPVVSPTKDKLLLVGVQPYPSIERVATPYLRLAGVRVEPKNHSKHDTPGGYGITSCIVTYDLVSIPAGKQTHIDLKGAACPQEPDWSMDGKTFAFQNIAANSVELWIGDAEKGVVHKVKGVQLNPMFGSTVQWMPDQKTLLVKLVPQGLGAPPAAVEAQTGPSIQETDGGKGQSSTYEIRDTLTNLHDEDVFDYYAASQLALVDARTGTITPLGAPAKYDDVMASPDGSHVLVQAIHKPYSYVTTYDHFPREVEVWQIADPAHVKVHTVASLPLADRVPIRGVPLGPREFAWRPTDPATLVWAEALDGGDWKVKVPARDKVLMQPAPFVTPAVEITRTVDRFEGFSWSSHPSVAMVNEYDNNKHMERVTLIDVDDAKQKPQVLSYLSSDEHYANPGNPVMEQLPNGFGVVRQDGDAIYMSGVGSSPDGDRPFLDKLNLKTMQRERMFRSDKTSYERFFSFTGPDTKKFLTWYQSPIDPPNMYLRTTTKTVQAPTGESVFASTSVAVTHTPDATPAVRAIKKRLVKYKRADGLDLSFTLYTPPGYVEGTRVPAILYAYPEDYADPSKAGQVTGSQQRFTQLYEYQLLLLGGYAIINNASFPIVGDPTKAYDTYLEQLVADAKAAVDEAVRIGVADPNRIGVTGHSHGALMTANLVAHTDLFKAGAATSGSYNKTLTPFGFQNEQRSVWEAQDVYLKASPFFFADKLKTPLLIVHGGEDANPGTTPLQSTKLYEAIRGNGGTARLVVLPHEPHWYSAMESNEQLIYEMLRWFDKYVKNAPPK
jgi:dipeptidyl aminopeptidase/acylaminoacyl peptidase